MTPSNAPTSKGQQPGAPGLPKSPAPGTPRRKKWRWLRRLLRLFLLLFLLFVLFIALLPSLISSGPVRALAITQASRYLKRPVALERLALSWAGTFEIKGLEIGPLKDEPSQPLFALGLLRAQWGWKPLFSKKVRVDECRLDGLRLTVARTSDGGWNLLRLIPAKPASAGAEAAPPPKAPVRTPELEGVPVTPPPIPELPVEALHVALSDWRVDVIDNVSTRPLRAAYALQSLKLNLDSPRDPLTLDVNSAIEYGPAGNALPLIAALRVHPGPKGFLAWQDLHTTGALQLPRQLVTLDVSPRGKEAAGTAGLTGLAALVAWHLEPAPLIAYAQKGLGQPLPAGVDGALEGSLRAAWDAATSASVVLRADYLDLRVSAPPLGPDPLDLGDGSFRLAVSAADAGPGGLAWSRWHLDGPNFDSQFVQLAARGDVEEVGAGLSPHGRLEWRLDHQTDSLDPILTALKINLPPQARMLREVVSRGSVEGGLDRPIRLEGELLAGLSELGKADIATILGVAHELIFDRAADHLELTASVGEFARRADRRPLDPAWLDTRVALDGVLKPDRKGRLDVELHPEPALKRVVALGLAPSGFLTTGTLAVSTLFALNPAMDASAVVNTRGALGFGLDRAAPGFAALPPALAGVKPAAITMNNIEISLARTAKGNLAVDTTGDIRLAGGYDMIPPPASALAPTASDATASSTVAVAPAFASAPPLLTRLDLPLKWDVAFRMPTSAPMELRASADMQPTLELGGAMFLRKTERVRLGADLSFDLPTGSLDLRQASAELGEWARLSAAAQLEQLGRRRLDSRADVDLLWGDDLLSWIPAPYSAMGFDLRGRTQIHTTAQGRWDPETPTERLKAQVALDHHFDSLRIGPGLAPLARGRDWDAQVRIATGASPAQPLQEIRMSINASLGHTDALQMVALEQLSTTASFSFVPVPPMQTQWNVTMMLDQLAAGAGPLPVILEGIGADTRGQAEVKPLSVRLNRTYFGIRDLLRTNLDATFTSDTQTFSVQSSAEILSLRRALDLPFTSHERFVNSPPEGVRWTETAATRPLLALIRPYKATDGRVEAHFAASGKIPTPEDVKALRLPFTLDASLAARDTATTLPLAMPIKIEGLNQEMALSLRPPAIETRASGSIQRVGVGGPFPLDFRETRWKAGLGADWEKASLRWTPAEFAIPNWGITLASQGRVEQWDEGMAIARRILRGEGKPSITPQWIMDFARHLSISGDGGLVWESADWMPFAPSEARARGRVTMASSLSQEPGREVRSVSGLEMRNFDFALGPNIHLNGANGQLEMLVSGRRQIAPASSGAYLTDRLFSIPGDPSANGADLEGLPRAIAPIRPDQASALRIAEIAVGPWVLRDLVVRSQGDIRRWRVDVDCDDLMSGKLRARMALSQASASEGGGWLIEAEMECTGVSGRSAVPGWDRLDPAETELSAVGEFRWRIAADAKTPDELLRGIEARFVVTHVGSRALQSFLLALDPKEENPAFVAGRQGLNLGRPNYFLTSFRHGLLDVEVGLTTFTGVGFRMPLLQRAPVGEVTRLDALRAALQAVAMVRTGLDAFALLDEWATLDPGATFTLARKQP